MGRVLKAIMSEQFERAKIDPELFQSKDQFRVLLILFSTAPLLSHYLNKGICIYKLKSNFW